MITVRLLGGAKKSFSTDRITIKEKEISVQELLEHLISQKPPDAPELDTENILVAINGADSSALGGKSAIIHENDTVSIIPVIHGGSPRIRFVIEGRNIEAFAVSAGAPNLDELREKFPSVTIQAVSKKYILNKSHIQKILAISIRAKRRNIMLSKRLETDILMRFAGTRQISYAISRAGAGKGDNIIIAMGPSIILNRIHAVLARHLISGISGSEKFLAKEFKISKKHLAATHTASPLEDILAENAAVLL